MRACTRKAAATTGASWRATSAAAWPAPKQRGVQFLRSACSFIARQAGSARRSLLLPLLRPTSTEKGPCESSRFSGAGGSPFDVDQHHQALDKREKKIK